MTVTLELLAVAVLILLNGYFVAAEYALVTVRKTRIAELQDEGNRRARHVLRITADPPRFIAAMQLGVTLTSLGIGALGEQVLATTLDEWLATVVAVLIAFTIITFMHVVVGELVPKGLALSHAERVALAVSTPVRVFFVVFKPFIWFLQRASEIGQRLIGVDPSKMQGEAHSEAELKMLLEVSSEHGEIQHDEREMLYKVFDFADKEASDVMVPRPEVVALSVDMPPEEALRAVLDSPYTRYPVFRESLDDIVGVLHVRDLVSALNDRGIADVELLELLRPAYMVPETKDLAALLGEFRRTNQHMSIVVDEYGSTMGIVTLEDLLEEIVGDIEDEFDLPDESVERVDEHTIRIDGTFTIDDFNEQFDTSLDQEDYHTVAGYVFGHLGRAAEPDDEIRANGLRFTVLETSGSADPPPRGRVPAGTRGGERRTRSRVSRRGRGAFRERDYRFFWLGVVLEALAMNMMTVAVGWQVYDLTGDPLDLGLIGLLEFLPLLLLALPAGQMADRLPRRALVGAMLGIDTGVAVALLLLSASEPSSVRPYFALALCTGIASGLGAPASRAMTPTLIPAETLPSAMALNSTGWQGAVLAGPAIGGLLFTVSPELVYGCAAALSVVAAGCIALVRERYRDPYVPERASLRSLLAGVALIRRTPVLLGAISLDLFAVLLGGAVALTPVFAKDILDTGPAGLGLLRSAPAVGAIVAGALLARRPVSRRAGPTLIAAVAGFGAAMVVFGLSREMWLSLLALAAAGALDMVSVVLRATILPLVTPDALRGRVNAVEMVFISGWNELGAFESGVGAALLGAAPAVVLGGVATVAVALVWMRLFPSLSRVDRLEELEPAELAVR